LKKVSPMQWIVRKLPVFGLVKRLLSTARAELGAATTSPACLEPHREFLLRLLPPRSVGCEIGVHKGDNAERILALVRPRKLHLVDPWLFEKAAPYQVSLYGTKRGISQSHMDERYRQVRARFELQTRAGQVVVHRGYSHEVAPEFPDAYFDWVYIDGNHLYEYALRDLETFYPKVKGGGIIAGDDYEEVGWWQGGVRKAVDEFVARGDVTLLQIKNSQYILRKGPRHEGSPCSA
jgi:hypothetical protein